MHVSNGWLSKASKGTVLLRASPALLCRALLSVSRRLRFTERLSMSDRYCAKWKIIQMFPIEKRAAVVFHLELVRRRIIGALFGLLDRESEHSGPLMTKSARDDWRPNSAAIRSESLEPEDPVRVEAGHAGRGSGRTGAGGKDAASSEETIRRAQA